ncbi:MAG: hypothetical protein AB4426_22195, partial [Xenococcaceae cyanobacterium]
SRRHNFAPTFHNQPYPPESKKAETLFRQWFELFNKSGVLFTPLHEVNYYITRSEGTSGY